MTTHHEIPTVVEVELFIKNSNKKRDSYSHRRRMALTMFRDSKLELVRFFNLAKTNVS